MVNNLSVYPNPASDILKVNFNQTGKIEILTLSLCDVQGRILLQQKTSASFCEFDISALASGNYFLKISHGKDSQIQSVIIKN